MYIGFQPPDAFFTPAAGVAFIFRRRASFFAHGPITFKNAQLRPRHGGFLLISGRCFTLGSAMLDRLQFHDNAEFLLPFHLLPPIESFKVILIEPTPA